MLILKVSSFTFTDYQYGPGFPGLGLLNPWLDAAYLGHAWHLPHPALVKGKHFRKKTIPIESKKSHIDSKAFAMMIHVLDRG